MNNNILNEIGIETTFSFLRYFCIGVLEYYTGEMQLSYLCLRNYAERSQSFICCISTYHQDAQGQILSFSWL
jgi:hypothetical protein